jgi:phage shock protein PspC (stress-responsive transcriptional regulator)
LALIVFGLWLLVQSTGIIPAVVLDTLSRSVGALAVIGLGIAILWVSRRTAFTKPAAGTRLYRSRTDRWIGGVLGGLGAYLGIDPLVLRIGTILLTVLGNGSPILAYIVMWILVPEEPLAAASPVPPPAASPPPTPPSPPTEGS